MCIHIFFSYSVFVSFAGVSVVGWGTFSICEVSHAEPGNAIKLKDVMIKITPRGCICYCHLYSLSPFHIPLPRPLLAFGSNKTPILMYTARCSIAKGDTRRTCIKRRFIAAAFECHLLHPPFNHRPISVGTVVFHIRTGEIFIFTRSRLSVQFSSTEPSIDNGNQSFWPHWDP